MRSNRINIKVKITHINLSTISNTLTLFSCFYDKRFRVIRLLGISSNKRNISCNYYSENSFTTCNYSFIFFEKDSAGKAFKYTYINIIIYLKAYISFPKYVSIENKHYNIIYDNNERRKNALCITTFKQFVSYNLLHQSLSIYSYYGVNHVFIYQSDNKIDLDKFNTIHGLTIHVIHIHNEEFLKDSFYFGQTVKYNDCLYRNMYNSNYIIFVDFDEIIVLKTIKNFQKFFSTKGFGDIYYFRSSLCPTTTYTENKYFHILNDTNLKNTIKCCMLKSYYHRKYIITSPQKFIKINIHFIDYSIDNYKQVYVNSLDGYIHHSRIPTYLLLNHCTNWFNDYSLKPYYYNYTYNNHFSLFNYFYDYYNK